MTAADSPVRETPVLEWWRPEPPETPRLATEVTAPGHTSGQGAYYALLAFTVVLIAAPQEFMSPPPPLRLALLTAVVAMVAYAVNVANGRARLPVRTREVAAVLVLVAWAFAMVPFSYWPNGSVGVLTDLYLKAVAIFILLAGAIDSGPRLRGIVWTLALCTVPIAATALSNYQSGVYLARAPGRITGYGTSGLAGNPNDLALLLNLTIPFLVALIGRGGAWWARTLAAFITILAIGGIIVTFSRAGFLTLTVIGLLYLWQAVRRGHVEIAMAVVVAAVAAALLAPAGYGDRLSTVGNIDTDPTGSAQGRWRDIVVAAGFVGDHPVIGAGAGMNHLALNERRGALWAPVHNVYLNYAVDLGLPGLVLFLVLFVGCLRAASAAERARRRAGIDDLVTRLAVATQVSLVAFSVAGFFYPVAYNAYFYYVGGLALALSQTIAREQSPAAESEVRDAD